MQQSHSTSRQLLSGPSHRGRAGFTVVELLIVIFIIALLATLILFGVSHAQRSSKVAKTRADFAAISTALEQYHSDFRVYPGMPDLPAPAQRTILAQALMGPGDNTEDGADGPGFRIPDNSTNPPAFNPNSKKWDAYLSPEHFKVQKFARGWALLDFYGNPIRYYPRRKTLNPKLPNSLVSNNGTCIFDSRDGENPQSGATEIDLPTLQVIVGDQDNSNAIDGSENLFVEGDFILASAGNDAIFTTYTKGEAQTVRRQKATKSDDIFNFDR